MVEILSSTTVHCGHMLLNCRWSWPWRSFMCLTCEYLLCVTWEYFISDLINLLSQMLSTPSNELWDLPLEGGDTNRAKHKQLLKTQCFNSNTAFFCFCFLDIFSSTYWFGISFFYQSITSNACICSVCVCVCVCECVCVCKHMSIHVCACMCGVYVRGMYMCKQLCMCVLMSLCVWWNAHICRPLKAPQALVRWGVKQSTIILSLLWSNPVYFSSPHPFLCSFSFVAPENPQSMPIHALGPQIYPLDFSYVCEIYTLKV